VTIPAQMLTRLDKTAVDNGFDQERPRHEDWLAYSSTHAPLEVWLTVDIEGRPIAGLSRLDVAHALAGHGVPVAATLPPGALGARAVPDVPALHRLLRRAYQLARTLPNELLHKFEQKTAALPRTTEAERLVVQRVGQNLFRAGLMEYWEGRCAVTGLDVPELLRASHIKPWADCMADAERLDVFNGLLLAPHLDAAFDGGFITVADDGDVIVSESLSSEARQLLSLASPLRVERLADAHRGYLAWHRGKEFEKALRYARM
jgi:putative restriction endonuclease